MRIDELESPPLVGETYLVPCVLGELVLYGNGVHWYPVFLPSHEDSKYARHIKKLAKRYGGPNIFPHHFHIDPRFTPEEWYDAQKRERHSTLYQREGTEVEWREMKCIREMPTPIPIYRIFGPEFVEDFKDAKIKCNKCPHKGVDLKSIPVKEGIIICPAHGMQFDADTKKTLL